MPSVDYMCGIIGYTGEKDCVDVLINGLSTLEYRGYDSAGIAVFDGYGKIEIVKEKGKVSKIRDKIEKMPKIATSCGIAHTRWATHGEPSDRNAHPVESGDTVVVHNGIIENYQVLAKELKNSGYEFSTDTDTEVFAAVIDKFYQATGNALTSITKAVKMIRGSFALGVMFKREEDTIYAVRRDSPLIIGFGEKENFIASDITAILEHTRRYCILREGCVARITAKKAEFFDENLNFSRHDIMVADWNVDEAKRGGYSHFMIKEINEEPRALRNTLNPRVNLNRPDFSSDGFDVQRIRSRGKIYIVGCGTAYHAALCASHEIRKFARIRADAEIASEFRYSDPILGADDTVILVSQSGETADTIAALRLAKERGAYTVGIVNVVASTIAREADSVIYTMAGPEIAVASTKAYTIQTSILMLLSAYIGFSVKKTDEEHLMKITESAVSELPVAIDKVLKSENKIKNIAQSIYKKEHVFFIGRGIDYYTALEASLKLKEISYIHSEAYAAGELKHGTISLIE